MRVIGLIALAVMLAACSTAKAAAPAPDYARQYLAVVAIYDNAVDTWDSGQVHDTAWMDGFAERMAIATRQVEEALVKWQVPDSIKGEVDELLGAEAEAHVAFLVMAVSPSVQEANQRLATAFGYYSDAGVYSEEIRVKLGLPSVRVSPHHYL